MSNDYKKLTRSRTQRMLCGVCGGLGEYLNLDPTIIRIIWVLFTFFSIGLAILVYFIAAVIIPDEAYREDAGKPGPTGRGCCSDRLQLLPVPEYIVEVKVRFFHFSYLFSVSLFTEDILSVTKFLFTLKLTRDQSLFLFVPVSKSFVKYWK